jgi:serine/threonine protein kinase
MATKALEPGMLAAPNIRLETKLAEGGMGSVWIAQHLTLKTRVAVKFMLAELGNTAEVIERFEREAQAVATIKSPHVVQVFDHGINEDGHPFIVMELLDGEDLSHRIEREHNLPLPAVAHIISQAAKALGKAHQLGIVHRDLKPENLFLIDVEGDVFVKVLDFGIAKRTEAKSKRMTATGSMLGTPAFMSPEQMTNAKAVGPASDQWALGIVVYFALTGELPFDGATMAALAIAVDRGVYIDPTARLPELPPFIDEWMKRVLQKDPDDRFPSVKEMADSLLRIAGAAADGPVSSLAMPPLGSTRAVSSSERGDMRTIRGTASESRGSRPQKVVGLIVFALVLVAAAVTGIFFLKAPSSDPGAQSARPTTEKPHAKPVKPVPSGPTVEPVAIEPPHPSAVASVAPTSTASALASATGAPAGSTHPPIHGPTHSGGAVPTGEIPTTF